MQSEDDLRIKIQFSPVLSVAPLEVPSSGLEHPLRVRVSAPLTGQRLPVLIFAHGFGSSMDEYMPLTMPWAAAGFVVVQPTFPDSRSLGPNPAATHSEAVAAFLSHPRKLQIWRDRIAGVKAALDHLQEIATAVPGLEERIDPDRIIGAGHSFGAQTIAQLLGARAFHQNGALDEDYTDDRMRGGVLLAASGRGSALSPFAQEHFPYLKQDWGTLQKPALLVAGDADRSRLTTLGPEWFQDAYELSPGIRDLLVLRGGQHMLGGITSAHSTETTDEDPARVEFLLKVTTAYLKSTIDADPTRWSDVKDALLRAPEAQGYIRSKDVR